MKKPHHLILLSTIFLLSGCRETINDSPDKAFSTALIERALEKVRANYVEKPDEKKMMDGALNGMLQALDPYSGYMNGESHKLFKEATKGEFGGLGMEVFLTDGIVKVIAPMDEMPAQKAGIKAGDIITHVDEISLMNLTPTEMLKKLHGKAGTTVTLKVIRGIGDPLTIKIIREIVTVNPIKYHTEGSGDAAIGYVRIRYFNDQTIDKLKEAILTIQKSQKKGKPLRGLVLDLRNNPGGTLDQAVAVSNFFLASGDIVHVKGRNKSFNQTFSVKGEDLLKGIPMAVVINQGSASASEIVAGALRDNKRAILVGEKSYGKGSVQAIYDLEGDGGLKLTIARFYTPKGDEIQGKGLQPDIVLAKPVDERVKVTPPLDDKSDPQLQRTFDLLNGLWVLQKK